MFTTSLKTISTVLAAAAIAVPVASGSNPTTPSVGQGFSLGVPLEYLNAGAPTHVTEGFSLGIPTKYLAKPTATARGNGLDWSAAAIGAGIVAGLFLMIAGIGAMTIRARQSQRAGRLSAT